MTQLWCPPAPRFQGWKNAFLCLSQPAFNNGLSCLKVEQCQNYFKRFLPLKKSLSWVLQLYAEQYRYFSLFAFLVFQLGLQFCHSGFRSSLKQGPGLRNPQVVKSKVWTKQNNFKISITLGPAAYISDWDLFSENFSL